MNTTLIFAELLIIGLEAGIWLFFLLLSFLGIDAFDKFLNHIKDWQLIVITITIPLLYVLGIIFDRIVDRLFRPMERKIEEKIVGDFPVTVPVMRFSLGVHNDFLNQQLEYTRTRMRIVRASTINFMLIAISISIFMLTEMSNTPISLRWQYIALILMLGLLFSYAAYLAWRFLVKGHLDLARVMYEYQNQLNKNKKTAKKN